MTSLEMLRASLLPDFLCRVGALSARVTEALAAPEASQLLREVEQLDAQLVKERDAVSAALFEIIGGIFDQSVRRSLLALRRDLFSLREPSAKAALGAAALRENHNQERVVISFVRVIASRDALLERYRHAYASAMERTRGSLWDISRAEPFQRGLALTSQPLYSAQREYQAAVAARKFTGTSLRVERALLRYVLRSSRKATPFASFCLVIPGRLSDSRCTSTPESAIEGTISDVATVTRLNKALLAVLSSRLPGRDAIKRQMLLLVNPCCGISENGWEFLDSRGPYEAFRTLAKSPAADLVLRLLQARPHIRYSDAVRILVDDTQGAIGTELAEQILDRLLSVGILLQQLGTRYQDPEWDVPFARLVESVDDDFARTAHAMLSELRGIVVRADHASVAEVGVLSARAEATTRRSLKEMSWSSETRPLHPLRTDATASATIVRSRNADWHRLEADLCDYVKATLALASPRAAQANMRHYFDGTWEEPTATIPLLSFYKHYYRDHYRDYNQRVADAYASDDATIDFAALANPFGLEVNAAIEDARAKLTALLRDRWEQAPMAVEVRVEVRDILDVIEKIPVASFPAYSISVLGDICLDPAPLVGLRLVIKGRNYTLGFGHMFSRWLHMVPADFLGRVREANETLANDDIYAEIGNDSYHNANLHPILVQNVIRYPGVDLGSSERAIEIADLHVTRTSGDPHCLQLVHLPTGRRVIPLDLGFLDPIQRPPLYRLLTEFSPPNIFQYPVPMSLEQELPVDAIQYVPRMAIGQLVLARRRWIVPACQFPHTVPGDTEENVFACIDRWRTRLGLPREMYVRSTRRTRNAPRLPAREKAAEDGAARGGDLSSSSTNHRKPQYLDFESPLGVGLLMPLMASTGEGALIFEEAYPSTDMLLRVEDEARAVETILQVDVSGSRLGPVDQNGR